MTSEMHEAVHNKIEGLRQIVKREFGYDMPDIKIKFNSRLKTTAGRAHYKRIPSMGKNGRYTVQLVPVYIDFHPGLAQQDWKEFMNNTVPHEYAHAVDFAYFNNGGHGATWKRIMRLFGCDPKRCHSLDTSAWRRARPYVYTCNCGEPHRVTTRKHRNMQAKVRVFGPGAYTCKRCNRPVTYSHHESNEQTRQPTTAAARKPVRKKSTRKAPVQSKGMTKIGYVRELVKTSSKTDKELVDIVVKECNINRSRARRYIRKARNGK